MDKEVADAFTKVLEYLTSSIGEVVKNNGSDVTEYMKTLGGKIVDYHETIALMWIIIAAVFGVVFGMIALYGLVRGYISYELVGACVLAIALIVGIYNAYTYIECKTFPEKVVLDYIQDEYNSMNNSNNR